MTVKQPSWDETWMIIAHVLSQRSKDSSTKVGCVIVDGSQHPISMGYNGMVSGVNEDMLSWGNDKSLPFYLQKYPYVVHAEANAILYTSRFDLSDCTVYATLFPCSDCTKLMMTKKIRSVVYYSDKYNGTEDNVAAKTLMDLCGCHYKQILSDVD